MAVCRAKLLLPKILHRWLQFRLQRLGTKPGSVGRRPKHRCPQHSKQWGTKSLLDATRMKSLNYPPHKKLGPQFNCFNMLQLRCPVGLLQLPGIFRQMFQKRKSGSRSVAWCRGFHQQKYQVLEVDGKLSGMGEQKTKISNEHDGSQENANGQ